MASDTRPLVNGRVREKIALQPGFHLMDWMRLTQHMNKPALRKITMEELAEHSSQFDCWTAFNGKVYNITQYLAYHPGGGPKLMEGAGKDCTTLFNKYHKWVNIDSILGKCVIGELVVEEAPSSDAEEGKIEAKTG